jgi:hypothetical protein
VATAFSCFTRAVRQRCEPYPEDEDGLQGQSQPKGPLGEVHVGSVLRLQGHKNIRGEDGDEKRDEAPAGNAAEWPDEQTNSAGHFGEAADGDEQCGVSELGRDDFAVEPRIAKVIQSGEGEKDCGGDSGGGTPWVDRHILIVVFWFLNGNGGSSDNPACVHAGLNGSGGICCDWGS